MLQIIQETYGGDPTVKQEGNTCSELNGEITLKLEIHFIISSPEEDSCKILIPEEFEENTLYNTRAQHENKWGHLTGEEREFQRNALKIRNNRFKILLPLFMEFMTEKMKEFKNLLRKYGKKLLNWIFMLISISLILFTLFMFHEIGWTNTVENAIGGIIAALISIIFSLLIKRLGFRAITHD
jgi:Fe2+ transport system protein B